MRICFVHEYLNQFGGAERMLQVLCAIFPDAPVYTLIYDANLTGRIFDDKEVVTSFLQKTPFAKDHHRIFPLLMPLAIEQFNFSEYDLVISLSASFAKGIITGPKTKHVCYCLTPPRFLWDNSQRLTEEFGFPKMIKKLLPPFTSYLRIWDKEASMRVDEFWSISNFIKERVNKYYGRESRVIYPPVNTDKFYISKETEEYFLMVGRLVSYKKFDLAINVFNSLGLPLKIVSIGPEIKRLQNIAKDNIEFLGLVSDKELADLYSHCKALVFPQEEDFGIVPLEAMASGRPVIAYNAGGARETIIDNKTGILFGEQTKNSIIEAINKFNQVEFDPNICCEQAKKFDISKFKNAVLKNILA